MYEYLIDYFCKSGMRHGRSLRTFSEPLDSIGKVKELEETLADAVGEDVLIRNFVLLNSPVLSTAKLEMENEKLKDSLQRLLEIFSGSTMEMLFSEEEYAYISSLKKEFPDI